MLDRLFFFLYFTRMATRHNSSWRSYWPDKFPVSHSSHVWGPCAANNCYFCRKDCLWLCTVKLSADTFGKFEFWRWGIVIIICLAIWTSMQPSWLLYSECFSCCIFKAAFFRCLLSSCQKGTCLSELKCWFKMYVHPWQLWVQSWVWEMCWKCRIL